MEGFFNTQKGKKEKKQHRTKSCVSCGLYKHTSYPKMEPVGSFEKGILNVFSTPSNLEGDTNTAFTSRRARYLKKFLSGYGIHLMQDCLNTYAVRCHTSNATQYNVACCRKYVENIIKEKKPKIIFLYGIDAVLSVIGTKYDDTFTDVSKWRGWCIPDQGYMCYLVPMLDIDSILDSKVKVESVIFKQDFEKALEKLKAPFPVFKEPKIHYLSRRDLSVLNGINGHVAIDYETTGLKPYLEGHSIKTASVAVSANEAYCFEVPRNKKAVQPLVDLLERDTVLKIAHNMKFEDTWGHVVLGADTKPWNFDTMLCAHLLDNRPGITGLKFQTYVQFGVRDYSSHISPYLRSTDDKNGNSFNTIDALLLSQDGKNSLLKYNAYDTIFTYALWEQQVEQLKCTNLLNGYCLLHDGILALARAERQGFRIDTRYCASQEKRLSRKIKSLEDSIIGSKFYKDWRAHTNGPINLNSGNQLGAYLYNVLKLKPPKTTEKGTPSTDGESLKVLNRPELDKLIERTTLIDAKDKYLSAFTREQTNGVLHPFYNLHTARTYRSSSSNPNWQNLPKRDPFIKKVVRQAIFPRHGHYLLEMDFSGVEVSVAATYHKDPTMVKYLKSGFDMHGDMAKQIFKIGKEWDKKDKMHSFMRSCVKNSFVFPQFYGDYYVNCAKNIITTWMGLPGTKWRNGTGKEFHDGIYISDFLIEKGFSTMRSFEDHLQKIEDHFWNKRFPVYAKWKESHYNSYLKNGFVDLYTGFRCSGIMSKKNVINYPIQGTAFHLLLYLLIQVDSLFTKYNFKTKIVGQIHDSLILDVYPYELADVYKVVKNIATRQIPKDFPWINVPINIDAELSDLDGSWYTMKEWCPDA